MRVHKKLVVAVTSTLVVFSLQSLGFSAEAKEKDGKKIKICHMSPSSGSKGRILTVSENSLRGHLGHGDPVKYIAYKDGKCEKFYDGKYK